MNHPIIYYFAYSGEQSIVDFTLPHWERYRLPLEVITPRVFPLARCDRRQISEGDNGPSGDPMYWRIVNGLDRFVKSCFSHVIFLEADSVCLLDTITFRNGLYGTPQLRPYDQSPEFMAERYVTPPQMMDKLSAERMLTAAQAYPDVKEGGNSDRLLAALANLAGVPVMPFPEGSWSEAQWSRHGLEEGKKESLRAAVKRGCKWFHFIKTQEQYDFILSLTKT